MARIKLVHLMLAAGAVSLAACEKGTTNPSSASLVNTAAVTADVASSSGDAIATNVATMLGDESSAGFLAAPTLSATAADGDIFSFSRTRTCYDSTDAVVANCSPTATRLIVTQVAINGSRTFSNETGTATGTGAVHRTMLDSLFRNFSNGTEVSRTHDGLSLGHDTTTFASATVTRTHDEAAIDSVKGVTWTLPHATHPWPSSGEIVRVDSVHTTFKDSTTSVTRDFVKVITVTFPPDSMGNVTLTIDGKSCTLNLVTHAVVNCH